MTFINLEGINNVRDLGGIVVAGDRCIKSGLFLRGSALYSLSEKDAAVLFKEHQISCIIDLRTGWERAEKPDKEFQGVENLHIPFYDLEKVGIEYTEPAAGTKVIGRDVACDPDHFYRSLANLLTVAQIKKSIQLLLKRSISGLATYFHCSGGKDRVGILTLCLLHVLGANKECVEQDYLLTNVARDTHIQAAFERFLRFTNDEERAWEITYAHRARPENLSAFYEAVDEAYGSFDSFIEKQLGVDDALRKSAIELCTESV